MSGFKPPELTQFYRSLRARGWNTTKLADQVGVTRPALTRVLNGGRRKGPIFKRAAEYFTAEEMRLLHVAHSSTWNTRRDSRP